MNYQRPFGLKQEETMLEFARGLLEREAARIVAYGTSAAVAGSLMLANLLGLTLPDEVLAGVVAITGFVITEVIRQLVFSMKTTQAIADRAAATGNTDIGSPPSGGTEPADTKPAAPQG